MTQRDDGHDYRDSKNKAMAYKKKKFGVALAGLNNQINRLNQIFYQFFFLNNCKIFL